MKDSTPVVFAFTLSLFFLLSPAPANAQESPEDISAQLMVQDEQGQPHSLREVVSPGPVLIIFWRLDSKPSREALIHFYQNRMRIEGRGIRPVAIAASARTAAADFVKSQGISLDSFYDPDGGVATAYQLAYVYPSLLLLDEDRSVAGKAEGGGASFDANLSRLLETEEPSGRGSRWILGAALVALAALAVLAGR
jgi:peroxiredoxin